MKTVQSLLVFVFFVSCANFSTAAQMSKAAAQLPSIWTAKQAVMYAKANNPDSTLALQRIEETNASSVQAKAVNYPQLNLSAEYGQTNNPMYSFGNILNQGDFESSIDFNDPGRTDDFQVKASLSYRLYNGGRDQAAINASDAHIAQSRTELEAVHRRLEFEVVKTYQEIIEAENMVLVRQEAIDAINAAYQVGRARFDAGDLLKQDLLNLELQQARANENLIQSRHSVELLKRAFLNLLGIRQGEVEIDSSDEINQIIPQNINYQNRHELKLLENAQQVAKAELAKAKGSRLPTLDAFASYQVDHGFVTEESGDSWMAGIRMNYLVFDGNNRSAEIAKAHIRLKKIDALIEKTELALNLEIQEAQLDYQQTQKRLAVTEKMVGVAEEVARLSRARFKEGVILASDLIEYEMRLSDARSRYLLALTGHRIAIAKLRRAAGLEQFPQS